MNFGWLKFRSKRKAGLVTSGPRALREFVYLDEVSLRSLLSSQKGEVTDTTSEQEVRAMQGELSASAGFHVPMLAKSEAASKFQTSNSSTLQTSRKATVQSWFREFHSIPGIRLVEPTSDVVVSEDESSLCEVVNPSIKISSDRLVRGELVEFRVRLTADPVFHLGTIMTEFSGMAKDHPDMFGSALAALGDAQLINKILQRLLTGLIPIRCEAVDYVVVEIAGVEYVVHREAISRLGLVERPFEIVGVTELDAYWKDIRRVLFSKAEFTILSRIGRTGLYSTWTPVKLADLLRPLAPDLADQINTASQDPFRANTIISVNTNELRLGIALTSYKDAFMSALGKQLSPDDEALVALRIDGLKSRAGSASGQRSAFGSLREYVSSLVGVSVESEHDLELREQARLASGLSLYPTLTQSDSTVVGGSPIEAQQLASRLLDVEVVAIYW